MARAGSSSGNCTRLDAPPPVRWSVSRHAEAADRWNDAAIPPQASIDYYRLVADAMAGAQNLRSFYRLFMAPGMEHRGGARAPTPVGGVFGLPSPSRDPARDVDPHYLIWGAAPKRPYTRAEAVIAGEGNPHLLFRSKKGNFRASL